MFSTCCHFEIQRATRFIIKLKTTSKNKNYNRSITGPSFGVDLVSKIKQD